MYDCNGHEIQKGDAAIATKLVATEVWIFEGEIVKLGPFGQLVLLLVVGINRTIWLEAQNTAVQLSDEA